MKGFLFRWTPVMLLIAWLCACGDDSGDGVQSQVGDHGATDDDPSSDPTEPTDPQSGDSDASPSTDPATTDTDDDASGSPEPPTPSGPSFEGAPSKMDLLFIIDNSRSMTDKQRLFAQVLPELVERLVSDSGLGSDLHVGVITTSLGSYGASTCVQTTATASEQNVDMAHLLGSLERGRAASPDGDFLRWSGDAPLATESFAQLVTASGEFGCGWEATLESWVRFLIDPYPYTKIVRMPCSPTDTQASCAGPEQDAAGGMLVDSTLLAQRAAFLRPDSLVGIVMLSDENDCSFRPSGQSWLYAQVVDPDTGVVTFAPRASAACEDPSMGADHACCVPCAMAPPAGCPVATSAAGTDVSVGCEGDTRYGYTSDGRVEEPLALRCWEQKRRFGVDMLLPTARYHNALTRDRICPSSDTLAGCDASEMVENPLFASVNGRQRPVEWVVLAGVVGVPWQDIAVSVDPGQALRYRSNDPAAPPGERIDWSWIVGERNPVTGAFEPLDPLMRETPEVRTGQNPATGEALAPPTSPPLANSINGHEWNSMGDVMDLQYACIFPLDTPQPCPSQEDYYDSIRNGDALPACECSFYGDPSFSNPVCQSATGEYGQTQYFGRAFPALRQLDVLRRFGANSVVASICPKETQDPSAVDYGYRPFADAMLERLRAIAEAK